MLLAERGKGQGYSTEITMYTSSVVNGTVTTTVHQGFMQDQIIASHTCFGGHMDVNC